MVRKFQRSVAGVKIVQSSAKAVRKVQSSAKRFVKIIVVLGNQQH